MKPIGAGDTAGGNRGGYGMLLMILVTIAVAIIFYMVWTSGPAIEIGKGATDELPPWKEWERLRVKLRKEAVGRPSAEQPELSNPLGYAGAAYEGDADRGEISLFITPDGNVMGGWTGQYYITKKLDHQIMMCHFNGYINPSKEYEDANGVDASQLYFIAKGPFSILETNAESGRVRNVMGNIYATGWINKEHYVYGRITITSDEKHFRAYCWEGPAREDVSVPVMQGLPGI